MGKNKDGFVLPGEDGVNLVGGSSGGAEQLGIHEEFMGHPERFKPTSTAFHMAYVTALGESYELFSADKKGREGIISESINNGELGRIFVEVGNNHDLSEGQGPRVYNVVAIKGAHERVTRSCEGFELTDLIERVPEPE